MTKERWMEGGDWHMGQEASPVTPLQRHGDLQGRLSYLMKLNTEQSVSHQSR